MRGFSVVELVTVLLLLGILSATALSRFVQPSAFAPATISQALVAQGRFASQSGHARRGETLSLAVARAGADWLIEVRVDGAPLRRAELDVQNTRVYVRNGGPATELDPANGLDLTFDQRGALSLGNVGGVPLNPLLGAELEVQGDSTRRVCFYPTGYVSDAACQ